MKLTKQKLRLKADKLLQDYIRFVNKGMLCYYCGIRPVTVGHHFFPVSNSLATRYYLQNIVPLCQRCHCLVHAQPHLVSPIICFRMGKTWYEDLLEVKRYGVKFTKEWIQIQYNILKDLYEKAGGRC